MPVGASEGLGAEPSIFAGLAGRVAIVTGGASGIGAGIAALLAQAGATVIIADRDEAGAQREAARLRDSGLAAEAIALDLADETSIVGACAAIAAAHPAPWLLVNNAGLQTRETLLEGSAAHWDRMHDVNARGAFLMTREIARAMVAAGKGGRIVNIASNCVRAPMIMGLAAYAASKGALHVFSQTAAFELVGHGITVNTVLPGGVITPGSSAGGKATGPAATRRPPLGMCEPRDIAAAVMFFATPAARYVTNQSIEVDAGFSLT